MSLRIGTLTTHCLAQRGQEAAGALVDTVARERLPDEIAARLGPSLDREAAIVRLRGLDVRVRIDTASLRRGALADVWARAVVRALHEALARPEEGGERLRRFDGCAAYLAAMIAAVLTAAPRPAWQFPEIAEQAARPPTVQVLDLLEEAGALLGDVLAELRRQQLIDAALAMLDEVCLERLIRTAATTHGGTSALDLDQLLRVAAALVATAAAPQGSAAASRRQAVRLWLQLDRALPLRGIWNALRLLLRILEQPSLLAAASRPVALPHSMPPWCEAVLETLRRGRAAQAMALLGQLRQVTPTAAAIPGKPENWLASDCAGVLLLCDTIRRLGWMRLLRDAGYGARVSQALLVGIGMRLLGGSVASSLWEPGQPIEPAVGLLGGLLDNPDARAIGRVFAETPPGALAAVAPGGDWQAALDRAADVLAGAFAARIRGFRNAKRASIVRHFLRRPGRILIEETSLRVVLRTNPFAIAMHIAGADAPVVDVEWLGGRRVEFVLEGL
jgi:hypothetical protein